MSQVVANTDVSSGVTVGADDEAAGKKSETAAAEDSDDLEDGEIRSDSEEEQEAVNLKKRD